MREKMGKKPLYGTRHKQANGSLGPYEWKSFDEIGREAVNLAKACQSLDFCPIVEAEGRKFKTIGVYLKTREEWLVTWFASWYLSGCVVPLYDTLGDDSIQWIVQQAELKTILTTTTFVGKLAKLKAAGGLKTLQFIISVDEPTEEEKIAATNAGIKVFGFKECLEIGEKIKEDLHPKVTPDSLAMLCFTSGTTSRPKGVMLTHRNYISLCEGVRCISYYQPVVGDTGLCWLPLAHIFEQIVACFMLATGVKLGFYSGDNMKLVEDIQLLHPNYFGSVPRIFNRIYEATKKSTDSLTGYKKYLYEKGVATKLANLRKNGCYTHKIYDLLVFKKIRNTLGGKMKITFVGGAPFAPEIQELSRVWLSCIVIQAYGQTETTGPVFNQGELDNIPGSVGMPFCNVEAKLIDIPEMNYLSTDKTDGKNTPRGEILVRGPACSLGYFKEPELTKETFSEGWVHTGDVGMLFPGGQLKLIDRRKNIFKLAQVKISY